MNRQEEIREGLTLLISECYSKELSACELHPIFQPQKFLNKLFPYLHSQGVVIRVDKPFRIGESINDDGLVAVAPLIEEK